MNQLPPGGRLVCKAFQALLTAIVILALLFHHYIAEMNDPRKRALSGTSGEPDDICLLNGKKRLRRKSRTGNPSIKEFATYTGLQNRMAFFATPSSKPLPKETALNQFLNICCANQLDFTHSIVKILAYILCFQ